MNIKQVRDKIRGLSNPEGINQYTKGGGGKYAAEHALAATAHLSAAALHEKAAQSGQANDTHAAYEASNTAYKATHVAQGNRRRSDHYGELSVQQQATYAQHAATTAHLIGYHGQKFDNGETAQQAHIKAADYHRKTAEIHSKRS